MPYEDITNDILSKATPNNDKIPKTNKTRPINEIIAPVISKSFLDSVGVKSGILFLNIKISNVKKLIDAN